MGIRDVPPTSKMRETCSIPMWAEATARSSALTVSPTRGRTIDSNSSRVRRTSVCTPGNATAIVVSLSVDSASFARRQSDRKRAWAGRVNGSLRSAPETNPSSVESTCAITAWSKSIPPSRSIPSGTPMSSKRSSVRRTNAASKVPPPKSYTATISPVLIFACREYAIAAASGSVTSTTCCAGSPASADALRRRSVL